MNQCTPTFINEPMPEKYSYLRLNLAGVAKSAHFKHLGLALFNSYY